MMNTAIVKQYSMPTMHMVEVHDVIYPVSYREPRWSTHDRHCWEPALRIMGLPKWLSSMGFTKIGLQQSPSLHIDGASRMLQGRENTPQHVSMRDKKKKGDYNVVGMSSIR